MIDVIDEVAAQVRAEAQRYAVEVDAGRAETLRGWCAVVSAVLVGALRARGLDAMFVSGHFANDAHHCWVIVRVGAEGVVLDLTATQFHPFEERLVVRLGERHPDRTLYAMLEIGAAALRHCLNGIEILRVMELCRRLGAAEARSTNPRSPT